MTEKYTFKGSLGMLIRQSLRIIAEESVVNAVSAIHNYQARMDATIDKYEILHKNYFAAVFRAHSEQILKGYKHDSWLTENDVRVVFGSENPEASHKGYIPISDIYRAALRAIKRATTEDDQIIIYPQIFLLHLYRVFNSFRGDAGFSDLFTDEVCDGVFECMATLEAELKTGTIGEDNIRENKLSFRKTAPAPLDPTEALRGMMDDPMLDNIFGLVTNTFAQSGMIPKEELEKISVNDIRKQFNSLLGTDALKKTFDKMNLSMGSAKTPEEAIQVSMKMMADENFMKEFVEAANGPGSASASGEDKKEKEEGEEEESSS